MDASLIEVDVIVEEDHDGKPVIDHRDGLAYCRISWPKGGGPPSARGLYMWTSDDYKVFYVGKATSDRTSHLYRRITVYKRVTPGKTQWTSLRLNSDILGYVQDGGRVRLICLATPDAEPDEVTRTEQALIDRGRRPGIVKAIRTQGASRRRCRWLLSLASVPYIVCPLRSRCQSETETNGGRVPIGSTGRGPKRLPR